MRRCHCHLGIFQCVWAVGTSWHIRACDHMPKRQQTNNENKIVILLPLQSIQTIWRKESRLQGQCAVRYLHGVIWDWESIKWAFRSKNRNSLYSIAFVIRVRSEFSWDARKITVHSMLAVQRRRMLRQQSHHFCNRSYTASASDSHTNYEHATRAFSVLGHFARTHPESKAKKEEKYILRRKRMLSQCCCYRLDKRRRPEF